MDLRIRVCRKVTGITIFISILLFSHNALAQLNSSNLTQYTELDGLPGAQVNKVLVDRFGYIWVGTVNGLARFDGYDFKRYFNNPNDTASIRGLNVWALFEDSKGKIWTASAPGALNVYDPATKSFSHYELDSLVERPANIEIDIMAFAEDNKGRIYMGMMTNYGDPISPGLFYIDKGGTKIKKADFAGHPLIKNVYRIIKDNNGEIWFLSYSGIFKIDGDGNLHRISSLDKHFDPNGEGPSNLRQDKEGHIWIITNKSRLIDFNPSDSSFVFHTPQGSYGNNFIFNALVLDKDENVWMGTSSGLIRYNKALNQFEYFRNGTKEQLERAPVNSMQIDSFGTLWMGTVNQGLIKYNEKAVFKSFIHNKDDKTSITLGWANSIYESRNGKIWITTSGAGGAFGLNELDLQTNSIHPYTLMAITGQLEGANCFYEIIPGELLVSTNSGTYQFSTKTNTSKKISLDGVPDNTTIIQFYPDRKGNLWLCTMSGLFRKENGSTQFKRYDLSKVPGGDAGSNDVTQAYESDKHGLWLATDNGLFLYNYTSDKIERRGYDKKAGNVFISQDINAVYEDEQGITWVGCWQGGLNRYNSETKEIKTYTRESGLPSMSIQSILPDVPNKTLWLGTFDGLSRFDMATDQFYNYSIADGIQGQLFADGSRLKTSGGLFIFGGANGITIFNPNDIGKKSMPPKVFLTDLRLFDKSVVPGENSVLKQPIYDTKEIMLSHEQNNISIEFVALHYDNPSKNKYAYKLENYDNDWREVGDQHVAFYPNLPPGKYLFRVKAANNNGVWNETGASLQIIVKPPWWKTTLAYIIFIVLAVAGIFAIDRYFRHRLVQKERQKNQVRELAQAKEIEKAYRTLEQTHETLKKTQAQLIQSEKMASLGELTAGIAHEIQNPLNFVNNFSEVNVELLNEMEKEFGAGNKEVGMALSTDVKSNLEKIIHHGKRADAIVKGMLQHSQSGLGIKEPTDLNQLADEYLRLSYHGLRAKNKNMPAGQGGFNTALATDFDKSLSADEAGVGKINIVAQEIGRVLLNLYNNAFYAVMEKKNRLGSAYEPAVSVSTKRMAGNVEIRIKDNGGGIPKKVLEKIFQPFFTTKPAGEGTGLGLSLSYDIIKAHGGEIKVETVEGESTEFVIVLPVK